MENMKDLIVKRFEEMHSTGKIEEIVDKALVELMKDIMHDMFRSYGDFAKSLKEKVSDGLKVNLDEIKLEQYSKHVLSRIQNVLNHHIGEKQAERIKELVEKQLSEYSGSEITFNKIIEKYVEQNIDRYDDEKEGEITIHVERSEGLSGLTFVYIDPKENKASYECRHRITINNDGLIVSCELTRRNKDVDKYNNFETLIQSLFFNSVKVTNIDEECDARYYGGEED